MRPATLAAALALLATAAAAQAPVAGLRPDQRPEGAPSLAEYQPTPEAVAARLRGVSEPVPANVRAAASAGPWYMPLQHRGMTPPYDPRGWWGATSASPATAAAPATPSSPASQ